MMYLNFCILVVLYLIVSYYICQSGFLHYYDIRGGYNDRSGLLHGCGIRGILVFLDPDFFIIVY